MAPFKNAQNALQRDLSAWQKLIDAPSHTSYNQVQVNDKLLHARSNPLRLSLKLFSNFCFLAFSFTYLPTSQP